MTLIEAAKQALDALDRYAPQHGNPDDMSEAITALRTAIAEAEKQEPRHTVQSNGRHTPLLTHMMNSRTTPPAEQRQPEHKGCACRWDSEGDRTVTCERHQGWLEVIAEWADRAREAEAKLKATTPAAQRQPLTEDQIDDIWNRYCDEMGEASINDAYDIARAIEAAHGIGEKT